MYSVRTMRDDVIIRQGEELTGGASDNFYVVGEGKFVVHRFKDSDLDLVNANHDEATLAVAAAAAAKNAMPASERTRSTAAAAAAATEGSAPAAAADASQGEAAGAAPDTEVSAAAGAAADGSGTNAADSAPAAVALENRAMELVQKRGVGEAFGELALMYSVPRQATVTCVSDYAVLWALQRQVYRDVTQLEVRTRSRRCSRAPC